jgi:tetratricopeptide (TPR) repeat protein
MFSCEFGNQSLDHATLWNMLGSKTRRRRSVYARCICGTVRRDTWNTRLNLYQSYYLPPYFPPAGLNDSPWTNVAMAQIAALLWRLIGRWLESRGMDGLAETCYRFARNGIGKFGRDALVRYDRAIALNADDSEAFNNRGNALRDLKRFDEALASFDRAISLKPDFAGAYNNRGIVLWELRRFDQALPSFERAIAFKPDYAEAHYNRGLALCDLKQLDEAMASFDHAISLKPDFAGPYNNRGIVLWELKRFDQALPSFDRAIALEPDYAEAHYNRGNALLDLQRFDEALASFGCAITLKPDSAEAYSNRGAVLVQLKRFDQALGSFDRAIALKPDDAGAYYNRGLALYNLERLDEAMASFDRAITLRPDSAEAYSNRGLALIGLKRPDEALESFDRAIALKPDFADAHINRGLALLELERPDEALENSDLAMALKPDFAEAYSNRGSVLMQLTRFDKALESFDRAIALKPDFAVAHNNRGHALYNLKRLDEAMAAYDRAIAFKPDCAGAYFNKSLLQILTGEFEEGWKLFEWRWKDQLKESVRNFSQLLWLGRQAIARKTLLIHAEQGLGDVIQFCRYATAVEALGAKLIVEVPASLIPLISTLKGNFTVVEKGKPLPAFDLQCPIMSLPLAFTTTVSTIPAEVPYLYADSGKRKVWQQRLGNKTRIRVGLAWSGAKKHKNDQNRSIPLRLLESWMELPIEFHSLQKDIRSEDAVVLSKLKQINPHHAELHDFSDTAALVQEMDLVISVDTSVAHLAGALAKSVWILLPFMPDFRWMLDRADSPWYPTATLFRQPAIGDWTSVIVEITKRLETTITLSQRRTSSR